MKRKIGASTRNTKLILGGVIIWLGFFTACGLFWWGIYLGDQYRATILKVERSLFGEKHDSVPIELDSNGSIVTSHSEVPNNSSKKPTKVEDVRSAGKRAEKTSNAQRPSNPSDESLGGSQREADAQKPQTVETNRSEPIQNADLATGPVVKANEDDTNLSNLRTVPVTKQIKILVADGYAASQSDWIAQTVRAVTTASRIFNTEFGIELRVVGVVRWMDALPDMTNDELLTELKKHPREGADMLLGFVDKELNGDAYSLGAPDRNSPYNGAYGLVGRASPSEPIFLVGVLRSIGYLMGAEQVSDTQSEAYRLRSWMSDARQPADRPPWIDMPNRKRILLRKSLPSWNPADPVP